MATGNLIHLFIGPSIPSDLYEIEAVQMVLLSILLALVVWLSVRNISHGEELRAHGEDLKLYGGRLDKIEQVLTNEFRHLLPKIAAALGIEEEKK